MPNACALVVVRVVLGNGLGLDITPTPGGGEHLLAVGADDDARALIVVRVVLGNGLGLDVAPALGGGGCLLAVRAEEE